MSKYDFSLEDLYDFAQHYYEIVGSSAFKDTFVRPLGNDAITEIAQRVKIISPITKYPLLLTNKTRINFLSKLFLSNESSKTSIDESQIPIIDYSEPEIRFLDIKKREFVTNDDVQVIKLCVDYYLEIYGPVGFMKHINQFIFEIFSLGTQGFSELFQGYTKKVNYISINGKKIEDVKRKIIAEFTHSDKQMNSPYIVVVSELDFFNYDKIEMNCNYIIYQSKTYLTETEDDPLFIITLDENTFIEEISNIHPNGLPIKIEYLHKNPRNKTNSDLVNELKRKVANDNSQPRIKKAA